MVRCSGFKDTEGNTLKSHINILGLYKFGRSFGWAYKRGWGLYRGGGGGGGQVTGGINEQILSEHTMTYNAALKIHS